jgi:hypothetical protein
MSETATNSEGSGSTVLGGADIPVEAAPAATTGASNTAVADTSTPPAGVTFPDNWKEALDDDLRNDPALSPIQDIPNLVKSFINAQKMVGANKLVKPDKFGSEDDWSTFYKQALDIPESLEMYELEVPKESAFEDGFISQLKEFAYNNNFAPRQMNGLVNWLNDVNQKAIAKQQEDYEAQRTVELDGLKKEWGEAFQKRLTLAKSALREFGDDQVFEWLEQTGLGDDTRLIKLLAAMGETLKEDKIIEDVDSSARTPKELEKEVNTILSDFNHPYHVRNHPNHKAAVEEVQRLFSQMHPVKTQSSGIDI